MISDLFNVSGLPSETQENELEEEIRRKDIEKIKDLTAREQAKQMLEKRDRIIRELKAESQKREDRVQAEIRKRAQAKSELYPKPPPGVGSPTPLQREEHIRTQVRSNLGKSSDDEISQTTHAENKVIDEFVQQTLDKQREKSKTTRKHFLLNSQDITKPKNKRHLDGSEPSTRGRGRSR